MVAYVEYFNVLDYPTKIELVYVRYPAKKLLRGEEAPDLIFSSWLDSPEMSGMLISIDSLFRDELINPKDFFPKLLERGRVEDKQITLPFSFNLPAMVYRSDRTKGNLNQFVIEMEELVEWNIQTTKKENEKFSNIAFSPNWDMNFVYLVADSLGANFSSDSNGSINFDKEAIKLAVTTINSWISEIAETIKHDQDFQNTYFHKPMYELLFDERIGIYFSDIAAFALIPQHKRVKLDFRWLDLNGYVPVLSDYRSFAIPEGSNNVLGAKNFISWIYQSDVQEELFEIAIKKRIRVFGLTGGIPVLQSVSQRILPQYHDFLIGRLLRSKDLILPSRVSVDWEQITEQVIYPWLRGAIVSALTSSAIEYKSLNDMIVRWRLEHDF